MIIMDPGTPVNAVTGPAAAGTAAWQCLVRRGMLHSETEAIEHWQLPPDTPIEVQAHHGVDEAVVVLHGQVRLTTAEGERTLPAGHLALLPHGSEARLHAPEPATVLTVRCLARSVSTSLPARIPELLGDDS
ncbi:hypothetical protein ABZ299_17185 [Streptomyces sp. NPDC006184]|uniref:cupin domain-containing protein n=1 Tax=Streptomyces sp. NPDC006184 TaxID=3155455 RepID=UPI0033A1E1A7